MLEDLSRFVEIYPFPLWEGFLRILLAMLLGALIGLERERRRQPAGFRTHTVLAVGSALICIVSLFMPSVYGSGLNVDPSRIASQVVSGIGFLGAGAILRMGVSVKGLTTAASLWTTAGIGLAVGAGMYVLSVFSTLVLLLVLSLMSKIEREFLSKKSLRQIKVLAKDSPNTLDKITETFGEANILKVKRSEGAVEISLEVPYDGEEISEKIRELLRLEEVISAEVI